MRTRVVPSNELDTKDLRASAYVPNPRAIANRVVEQWITTQGLGVLINRRGKAIKQLKHDIERSIEGVM